MQHAISPDKIMRGLYNCNGYTIRKGSNDATAACLEHEF